MNIIKEIQYVYSRVGITLIFNGIYIERVSTFTVFNKDPWAFLDANYRTDDLVVGHILYANYSLTFIFNSYISIYHMYQENTHACF